MHARHGALVLLAVGVLFGIATGALALLFGEPPLVLAVATIAVAYLAAGATSLAALRRADPLVRPVLAVAGALVAVLLAGWLVASPLTEWTLGWDASLPLATVTVAFGFPLGLATARLARRIAAAMSALAVVPLLAVGWRLATDVPPDDPAFLFYLAIVLGLVLLGVALPLYLEGRVVARSLTGAAPSPLLPRALVTALTGVLVVSVARAFQLEGRLLAENPIALWVVLVVFVAFLGSVLRLGQSLSGSDASG